MSTISPFKEGAVIQVAQGVLRGVGPMGPRGFTGPAGPIGPQGIQGPAGLFEPVASRYSRSTTFSIANNAQWAVVTMASANYAVGNWSSLVTATGAVRVTTQHQNGIAILISPTVVIRPGNSLTETFRVEVGVLLDTSTTPFVSQTFTHNNGATVSTFSPTFQYLLTTTQADLKLAVRIIGASFAADITFASMALTNGGGTTGPTGPAGPTGPTGAAGPQGIAGNSNTGFSTFDGLDGAGDSDIPPATLTQGSQGISWVYGTHAPAIPGIINQITNEITKRFVRRFPSETELDAASDKEVGQLAFLTSNGSLRLVGTAGNQTVAQVAYGTTDPPAGTYPAGTIYFKVAP